jgi:hypothetical protein
MQTKPGQCQLTATSPRTLKKFSLCRCTFAVNLSVIAQHQIATIGSRGYGIYLNNDSDATLNLNHNTLANNQLLFNINTVPEPSACILLSVGLSMICLMVYCRRNSKSDG